MTSLEDLIAREVGRVITDASNFPEPMQAHMLGRDLSEPIDKIVAALLPVIRKREADAWDEGAKTILNFAVRNLDGAFVPNSYREDR